MYREEDCGCGQHGKHHGEQYGQEVHGEDCGCSGHEHHGHHGRGMNMGWQHHENCGCGCHQDHGGMRFQRHFISRDEVITKLEEYLKQLQAEARGVEERLTQMKK